MKTLQKLLLITMLSGLTYTSYADQHKENREKAIYALYEKEVNFIKEKNILSPQEGKLYFPLYKKEAAELSALRKNVIPLRKKMKQGEISEIEATKLLKSFQENEISEAQIRLKYLNQYLKFISAKKILSIKFAQKEFKMQFINNFRDKRKEKKRKDHNLPDKINNY